MKTKSLLLGFAGLLCLSSCGDDYIKCKKVTIGGLSYSTSEETFQIVAKYKKNSDFYGSKYDEAGKYYYIVTVLSFTKEQEATIPPLTNTISYYSGYYTLELVKEYGKFKSHTEVYYSSSQNQIKYTQVKFETVKASDVKELEGEQLCEMTYSSEGKRFEATYSTITTTRFSQITDTSYIDANSTAVTYSPF